MHGPHGRYRKICAQSEDTLAKMTIASDLLQQHIQTLVDDNAHWQTLIAEDIVWELAYRHGPRSSGAAIGVDRCRRSRQLVCGRGRELPLLRPHALSLRRSG